MSLLTAKGPSQFVWYTLSILAGILLGAIILLGLPLKWMMALIAAICLVLVMLIVQSVKRVLLFTITLIIPVTVGAGLPPVLTHSPHIGLSQELSVQLLDILVLSLMMFGMARCAKRQADIRMFSLISIPALVWLVVNTLSGANARDMDLTIIQTGNMVALFILYIIVANSIESNEDVKWLVWALLLGVLFQSVLGLYQNFTGATLGLSFLGEPSQLYYERPLGTIGHPNGYGAYLSATVPLALVLLYLEGRMFYKLLAIIVLCVGVLGLIFSLSRGAWLGFLVALIFVLAFAIRKQRRNLHTALVGAGSILLILLSLILSQQDLITTRLTNAQGQESAMSRVTMARGAIAMIRDHPMLGVGSNNYTLLMPEYDPLDYAREGRLVIVHNIFLLIAAETGLVGLAAFLWFLASLFIQAWRLAMKAPNDITWLGAVGALAGLAALAVHGMADYDVLANITVFRLIWLFAAIIAGMSTSLNHERVALSQLKQSEDGLWSQPHRGSSQVDSRGIE